MKKLTHLISPLKLLLVVFSLFLFSCVEDEEPRQITLDKELATKIEKYKKKKNRRCKEDMMEDISIEVDSIMYFLVAQMNGETEIMPERPPRPERLVDTISLETKEN